MIISDEWQAWVANNMQRGVPSDELLKIMAENNFDLIESQKIIKNCQKTDGTEGFSNTVAVGVTSIESRNKFTINGQTLHVLARLDKPVIVLVDNFLTDQECDTLIELTQKKLKPSKTVDAITGKFTQINARSSEGSYFMLGENDFIQKIDDRIAALMNFPVENGEGIQVLHYDIGGEYKAHFDYFDPLEKGSQQQILRGGNRVATLVMYLNDVTSGGETFFPNVGFSAVPKKGAAVYFENVNKDGQIEPLTLHAGKPVIEGEKWIATKWVRERYYGSRSAHAKE